MNVIEIAGWVGTIALLAAYGLLTAHRLNAAGWLYQSLNLLGAALLMLNSAVNGALPSAALNLVWVGIGVAGLVQARARRAGTVDGSGSAVSD